jgi:hypothetical protein
LGAQKAQMKKRKKHKTSKIFLCAFCVDLGLFVLPGRDPLNFRQQLTNVRMAGHTVSTSGCAPEKMENRLSARH